MAEDTTEGTYVGVTKSEGGELDFTYALKVVEPEQTTTQQPLQQVIKDAEAVGIKEEELKQTSQALRDKLQTEKRLILTSRAKQHNISPEEILRLTRRYRKEQIRQNENGELLHYHKTSFDVLQQVITDKKLMSFNRLKELDRAPKTTGTRPDVVQMTRDTYNKEGGLIRRGVAGNVGASGAEVALVFDSSVIDLPEYDAIDEYPNLPEVPLDKLKAVLVKSDEDKPKTLDVLQQNNIQAEVKTRSEWTEEHYEKK